MVQNRRKQLGLTLRQLAERASLSAPFLSQVENGLAVPSVGSMVKIAHALGVPNAYFLDTAGTNTVVHRQEDTRFYRLDGGSQVRYGRVGSTVPERQLEPMLLVYPPRYTSEPVSHSGEEFLYVLQGHMRLKVGSETHHLRAGDSAHFNSGLRHVWSNEGDEELRVLWVGTPALL
jgi:transcriptional regulator with XRE-family HTH domain